MRAIDAGRFDWLQLIRAEYLESPGLALTQAQVKRLWGLDELTCEALLDEMVADHFLRCTAAHTYIRADSGC